MKKILLLIIGIWSLTPDLWAQATLADSAVNLMMIQVNYRGHMPGADLQERFGYASQLGLEVGYKFASNWYLNLGGFGLFGDRVKESDLLSALSSNGGLFINDEGFLTDVRLSQGGWGGAFSLGKIFPLGNRPNVNSGFFVEIGLQYLQHKIIIDPVNGQVPLLSGDYRKGYDRLSSGFGLRESIGYRFFGNRGYLNFAVGLDFSQHFTRSRRSFQFDTGQADTTRRLDLLNGFYVAWVFPVFQRAPDKVYYY